MCEAKETVDIACARRVFLVQENPGIRVMNNFEIAATDAPGDVQEQK